MGRKRDPTKPTHSRSHTGCDRCRLRRRRCDELKPVCLQCSSRGYTDCKTSLVLKWQTDYVPLGKAHGRAGVWNKSRSPSVATLDSPSIASEPDAQAETVRYGYIQGYCFLHYSCHDLSEDSSYPTTNTDTALTVISRSASTAVYPASHFQLHPVKSLGSFHNDFPVDASLLSYYLHRICPSTVLSSRDQSPFASMLIPLCQASTSPVIAQSLMCLSASHRSREDAEFRLASLQYAASALRSLQKELLVAVQGDTSAYAQSLGAMLLLCQSEITRSCDETWTLHLKGARQLVRQRRRLSQTTSTEGLQTTYQAVIDFAERYFAVHDVLGRTACGEEPIFGADFWSGHQDNDRTDSWLGCSPKLFSIVSSITELSWKHQRSSDPYVPDITEDILESLRYQIATLRQIHVPQFSGNGWSPTLDLIDASAEAKRLAVEIYFYSALCGAVPASEEISSRVQQILRLVCVLLQANVRVGLTWPIFIAAVSLDPLVELEWHEWADVEDEFPRYARPFVLYALETQRHSLANVDRLRISIEHVWQARELKREKDTDTNSNDWFQFVAPFCHSISLA